MLDTGAFNTISHVRDHPCPLLSTPVSPNVLTTGAGRLRIASVTFTVPFAGICVEGKYFASGWLSPSIVNPVTMDGTPANSRTTSVVPQACPCASGGMVG